MTTAPHRDHHNHSEGVELSWEGRELVQARLRLPGSGWVRLTRPGVELPLLGRCDALTLEGEDAPRAFFSTLDYADPDRIPPLDRPTNLPRGAGTAVLNLIARLAQRAGRERLRYRGPYPTGALFDALLESFRLAGDEPADPAFTRFRADVEDAALSGEAVEPEVEFVPAPFERRWPAPHTCVQVRDGAVEKVYLHDRDYRRGHGARRVWTEGEQDVAGWWIAGAPVASLLTLSAAGEVVSGPRRLPTSPSDCGSLPAPLQVALGDALAERAPGLLRGAVRELLSESPLRWGDTSPDLIVGQVDAIVLHGALAEPLAAAAPDQAFSDLALLIEPTAQRIARRRLQERAES